MTVIVLLALGIVVFFSFFAFMGRVRKAGSVPLVRAPRRLALEAGPQSTAIPLTQLLARVELRSGPATPAQLSALLPALGAARAFPQSSWSPDDRPQAVACMHERLGEMGLELLDDAALFELLDTLDAGADRRRQIAVVTARANDLLERAGDSRRFRSYAEDLPGWDPREPAWLLTDPAEHQMLLDLDVLRPRTP